MPNFIQNGFPEASSSQKQAQMDETELPVVTLCSHSADRSRGVALQPGPGPDGQGGGGDGAQPHHQQLHGQLQLGPRGGSSQGRSLGLRAAQSRRARGVRQGPILPSCLHHIWRYVFPQLIIPSPPPPFPTSSSQGSGAHRAVNTSLSKTWCLHSLDQALPAMQGDCVLLSVQTNLKMRGLKG